MDKLKEWFNEHKIKFTTDKGLFVIYKGFKISNVNEVYSIQDVRMNDFYSDVKPKDLKILDKLGFVKGADSISHSRDLRRVKIYDNKIKTFNQNLINHKKKLNTNLPFYRKKIRNDSENVDKYINLLYFYKHRIIQHKNKYNLN